MKTIKFYYWKLFNKNNLVHLRWPFSLFLSPVFFLTLFSLKALNLPIDYSAAPLTFVILHFWVYPSSNAFNSFYDKDESSIGGLKNPPKTLPGLLPLAHIFDVIALTLSLFLNLNFAFALIILIVMSRLYSHPATRWKAKAFWGWSTVFIFQGAFTFIAIGLALSPGFLHSHHWIWPALSSSFLFGGAFPLTQIYQHKEDLLRGDRTMSLLLGVKGTFLFSMGLSSIGLLLFLYFLFFTSPHLIVYALLAQIIPGIFIGRWLAKSVKDQGEVNYDNSNRLSIISSLTFVILFISFFTAV